MSPDLRIPLLILAGGFIAGVFFLAFWAACWPGRPRHYHGEHVGATEQWSPKQTLPPPRPLNQLDPRVALSEAERDLVKAHDRVAACRDAVEAFDRAQLARIESRFAAELRKIGHLELDTVEVSKEMLAAVRR